MSIEDDRPGCPNSTPTPTAPEATGKNLRVHVVQDDDDLMTAFEVRTRVFHEEQNIPIEDEFDDDDDVALHVLATRNGEVVGTGRLLITSEYAKIGRMAVLAHHRRCGVGSAIIRKLIDLGRDHSRERFVLHAQVQAIPFYAALGFVAEGPEFDEAGIPHRKMQRIYEATGKKKPKSKRRR